MNFFSNLSLSSPYLWIIFIAGIIFAWLLSRLIRYFSRSIHKVQKNVRMVRKNLSVGTEARLSNDIYRFVQKQHLTASFFSLDEIAIVPKVLTPLIQKPKTIELEPTDSVSLTVPYIPDWPELAAVYRASTMTLTEALQGGANIILAGHPGSGKSVALAWLASSIIRNDPGLGSLEDLLPLYIHATEISHLLRHNAQLPQIPEASETLKSGKRSKRTHEQKLNSSESVDVLIEAISKYVSSLTLSRLPRAVRSALERNQAILLVDRMDELPPSQSSIVTKFLESLLDKFPKLRIVVTASYDDLAGLPALGFSLLGMAAWTDDDREKFLQRWSQLWDKLIAPSGQDNRKKINSYYLNSWLKVGNAMLNPLEYMLKVWAAYSGDSIGTDGPSAIEAYIRRMTSDTSHARASLELFGLQLVSEMEVYSSPNDSNRVIKELEKNSKPSTSSPSDQESDEDQQPVTEKPAHIRALSSIDSLIDKGILVSYEGSLYGFSHPIFSGYLAGNAILSTGTMIHIQNQPAWIGKSMAMYYFSRVGDVTPFINKLLQDDDILHTNHLVVSRWLQIAPKNRQWRSTILRTLTSVLNKERDTLSLAAKIISAMAFSGDAGVSVYFRQLLKSEYPNLKLLAALGCGILAEKKAIEDLNLQLQEPSPFSIRAASLALAAIGDKRSLEILATTLLNGTETSRRCAAEALANNPTEGHPALKEGSSMEDLMVRRSVAFGLIRVNQPWALKIVENMQLEDSEWVVRNAAIQAFTEFQRKNSFAPAPLDDPTEIQWLIDYATKQRTTVAPGKPADELVIKALSNGDQDEILNALEYLRIKCDADSIGDIYKAYTNPDNEIKNAAYYVLWLMMISGVKLPVSVIFNI